MTVEEVKALVKEKSGKEITDEQARKLLEQSGDELNELSDEQLDAVAGGAMKILKVHV